MTKLILVILVVASAFSHQLCLAESITVMDGDFSDWFYKVAVAASAQFSIVPNVSTVARLNNGGDPGSLISVTNDGSGTKYGIGIDGSFKWDPAKDGAISSISMSLDVKSISAWGQGQNININILQGGNYYFGTYDGINSGPATAWHRVNLSSLSENDFVLWSDYSIHPDFSENGDMIMFGFGAGNSGGYSYTQHYDNWSLLVNYTPVAPVPEPATILLLASGLAGLAGFRRKLTNR